MGRDGADFGVFPAHWQISRIGEFAKVKGGKRLPKGTALTPIPTNHPYIRVTDFKDGRIDDSSLLFVPEDVFPRIRRYTISQKDIYVSIVGTIGLVGIIGAGLDGASLTENAAKICDLDPNVDRDFLAAYLRSHWGQFEMRAQTVGSTQPKLALFRIANIRVPLPPRDEQRAVARILGTLDDKIELNRRMNETLEAMARAIFKSWFVDFDPVRAKAECRQPFGMDGETAALFPDSFKDSALGKIPKGWNLSKLGELADFAYGKGLKDEDRCPGEIPVYGSNGQVGWHNKALVKGPGVVVGRKGNPGTVNWVHTDFYPIDTTFYVVPKGGIQSMYYLFYILSLLHLPSLGADSAVPGLNRNIAYMSEIVVPSAEITEAFDLQCAPFLNRVQANDNESRTLAAIRDALLPKLISGEIRVSDADNLASRVK